MFSCLFFALLQQAHAVSARWDFYDLYFSIDNGNWYRDHNNAEANLAWSESYVMIGLASMAKSTQSPDWLDQLAWHADAVLLQRDDARGVSDFRGVSTACWQNNSYQPNDEAYCYVVHSGMIAYAFAEYARLVQLWGYENEIAYDGQSFGDKATAYTEAVAQVIAAHDDQWDDSGFYRARSDADFLSYAGSDLPLNMSNAMGRTLLSMYQVTGEVQYLDKVTALAERFQSLITDGRWNYWGGTYSSPGEDISHAAINADFAALCAENGIVFSDQDMMELSNNFMSTVYLDDQTFSDWVGGGSTNNPSYTKQIGRWVRLSQWRTSIYTTVYNYFADNPASSASALAGYGMLAAYEPLHCEPFFYYVDWHDPYPNLVGNFRTAIAYSSNILTVPPALDQGCMMPLQLQLDQPVSLMQWDGQEYHRVATWSAGNKLRFAPYEHLWPHLYWSDGILFQFHDDAYTGEGIALQESMGFSLPTITSVPPPNSTTTELFTYQLTGEGDAPFWWSLRQFPTGARIDPATGHLEWQPTTTGEYQFTVMLENNNGAIEQTFVYAITTEEVDDSGLQDDTADPADTTSTDTDSSTTDSDPVLPDFGSADDESPSTESTPDKTEDTATAGCHYSSGVSKNSLIIWLSLLLTWVANRKNRYI